MCSAEIFSRPWCLGEMCPALSASFVPGVVQPQPQPLLSPKNYVPSDTNPKDPAVLKILRVVNLLRVVFLLSPCDLLSRRTLCGHRFLGITDIFPSPRRVCVVVNLGGVVKTLRRSNSLSFAIVVVFLVRKGQRCFTSTQFSHAMNTIALGRHVCRTKSPPKTF